MKVTTTLRESTSRNGTSALGDWTMTLFKDDAGREFQTFDGSLASAAQALIGKLSEVEYEEKLSKDGKYTNKVLKAVAEATNGAVATPAPAPTSKGGEFRSPAQIIRTSALELAVSAYGIVGQDPVTDTDGVIQLAFIYEKYVTYGDAELEALSA